MAYENWQASEPSWEKQKNPHLPVLQPERLDRKIMAGINQLSSVHRVFLRPGLNPRISSLNSRASQRDMYLPKEELPKTNTYAAHEKT